MVIETPAPLQLSLLGVPEVRADGAPVALSLTRAYALLAYLALEGRGVPREHLAALLWPEAGPTIGRTRLRRLIYRIEALCGRAIFSGQESVLELQAERMACDATDFRRRARLLIAGGDADDGAAGFEPLAAAACRPLMDGLEFGSLDFDDWLRGQRIEHEQLITRVLIRLAQTQRAQGRHDDAVQTAERLLRLQPFSEPAFVMRMALAAQEGDAAGVDAVFMRCADALRAEFGVKPSAATEQVYLEQRRRAERPDRPPMAALAPEPAAIQVRFAPGAHGPVAYATLGQGRDALVVMPGFVSHIEIGWEHPGLRTTLLQLARRFTVVVFDRRGVGLSERIGKVSTVESMAGDVLAILDHAGIERAWLFGSSEGGPAAIRLAALHAQRIDGLILFGAMARGSRDDDYPWALRPEAFDTWMRGLVAQWGGPADIGTFAPPLAQDPWTRSWWARLLRHAASPASLRAVLGGLRDADVRDLLGRVNCPTLVMHRRGDRAVRFEAGEYLAARIRDARFMPLDGDCHWWWVGDGAAVAEAILDFAPATEMAR
ncbi:MAG: alpha/beta fold hydrolase [Piscinibacter sp.]|uniref:alpha/beta hydrolase n=1 Tax=Piscinibacter TaxID=1114981 RepID=UPI000FDEC88F|nr:MULTISPECIES: alpha/beta hydrolase [Piscinibacter]MCW5663234.1 alpha/beta fold hydrolase [Piscinibacter sp.]